MGVSKGGGWLSVFKSDTREEVKGRGVRLPKETKESVYCTHVCFNINQHMVVGCMKNTQIST